MLALLLCLSSAAGATRAGTCWDDAAQRYGIDVQLLAALADVESHHNPRAVNRSHLHATGTIDIGLMQINSSRLPALARYGIDEQSLYDPCTSIAVGAWTLADLFARHGVTWEAVGAYNAACTKLKGDDCARARSAFAWRVYRKLAARTRPSPANARVPAAPALGAPIFLAVRVSP